MRILDGSKPDSVGEAAEIIRAGGLVAFPTETVYGLGADACNPIAVARIFEVKRRPAFDPIIVHVANPDTVSLYGDFSGGLARMLIELFWPGPLTLVVRKAELVPPVVTAGLETVAVRMPSNPVALALIRAAGRAIAAPSANPFGYVSPTEAGHVASMLRDIDLILDGGRCTVGVESTIVSLAGDRPCLLRTGGISPDEIERHTGPLVRSTIAGGKPSAPGQLTRHYATRTPLWVVHDPCSREELHKGQRVGLLAFLPPDDSQPFAAVEVLSPTGDLREAAANLFSALRRLDEMGLDCIVAARVPEEGLGIAIMDRLRRCAQPE